MPTLTTNEVVLIGVLFIVLVVGSFLIDRLLKAVVEAGKTNADLLPRWAVDLLDVGGHQALKSAKELTDATVTPIDGELLALIDAKFADILRQLRGEPDATSQPAPKA